MVKVITRHGEHRVLEKIFNVSHVTVRRALNGETNTALAQRIRTAAIKRGARVMVEKDDGSLAAGIDCEGTRYKKQRTRNEQEKRKETML